MHRLCFYTVEKLLFKQKFLSELRSTFGGGGFICAFSERELSEFQNYLEKSFPFSESGRVKKGITCVGKQPLQPNQKEIMWILSPSVQINESGSLVAPSASHYVWQPIGGPQIDISGGRNFPTSIELYSEISLPLQSSIPLNSLLHMMTSTLKHNFIAGMYTV